MTKKIRFIILIACALLFVIIAPILVAYSEGYRFDFEKEKLVATGGIYIRSFPAADKITVDSKISDKPGIFSNSIFVQSLLPKNHTVLIQKNGYYDYFKTLPVNEGLATKVENVALFKKNIAFGDLSDNVDYFSIAPNNQNIITAQNISGSLSFNYYAIGAGASPKTFSVYQAGFSSKTESVLNIQWSEDSSRALIKIQNSASIYYYLFDSAAAAPQAVRLAYLDKTSQSISFSPQNSQTIFYIKDSTVYSAKGNIAKPIINNVASYLASGSSITWLSSKGTLSNSDFSGNLLSQASSENFPVNHAENYNIILSGQNTFLKSGSSLYLFNQTTKIFENFPVPTLNLNILTSPDSNNIIFWSKDNIYIYSATDEKFTELFSGGQTSDCQWLNNDYLIFNSGDKIIISEIDYRGNINTVTIAGNITLATGKKITLKNPDIFFNQQNGKLYVLTENSLLESEKILP